MADPVTPVVAIVDPDVKPANVVENVNDHTPEPETPPVVEAVPDPPRPDQEGLEQLQQTVADLATSVTRLTETVTSLVTGKQPNDESPGKRPWTHMGHAVHNEGANS